MTTDELEIILESGTESQSVDFKGTCEWNSSSFAQDILAMTNVQEGGTIIIGVKQEADGSFKRVGIKPEHKSTYKEDNMKDQIAPYADPHVNFSLSFPKDKDGLDYVVIIVEPFKEIPVICIKQSVDTKDKGIYYRNRDGKVESGLISNAYDLRDILERAAIKLMNRSRDLGYPRPYPKKFERLLERYNNSSISSSSNNDNVLKIIKERLKKERGDL